MSTHVEVRTGETQLRQRSDELRLMRELGLSEDEAQPQPEPEDVQR